MSPKVSVIIPAYNKAELTRRTVDSVLGQTYSDIEIIVVDDGSKDHTRVAMAAYGHKIKYVYKENGGACSARNEGIRQASGQYIALLDCDDLYVPAKIEQSVRYLQDRPDAGFVHTAAYFIDAQDKKLDTYSHPQSRLRGGALKRLILKNFICNSTVVARRECFTKAGLFDESIFVPADWDMWLRLSEVAAPGYIDEPLTMYRVTDNYTFNKTEQSRMEESKVIAKFFERNLGLSGMKSAVLSQWHLRFAQCYLLKNDRPRMREELSAALKDDPCNWKAWGMGACSVLFPAYLKNDLTRRILRHGG